MSDKLKATKKAEADAYKKEGDKLSKTTLLRWKADWDGAAIVYEKAANGYRAAKVYDDAKYCFLRLSLCQTNTDVYFLAAKSMENAAAMAKEMGDTKECVNLLLESCKLYRTNGNSFQAADNMTKAAKLLEDIDINKTFELLKDACELFELDDKDHFSGDTFKQTISLLLKHKKYEEAIDLMILQNRVFIKLNQNHDLHKSCLSVIAISLATDDIVGAKKKYDQFLDYPSFLHSQEGTTAAELINAFDNHDAEGVKNIVSRHLFNFLDNQVAKIAKGLSINSNSLQPTIKSASSNPFSNTTTTPSYNKNNNTTSTPVPTSTSTPTPTPDNNSDSDESDEDVL
ncbi:soluble NSF attachment protein gamma isoform [Dictyostelium purpureum]|uniref:Gamma-soluble NSF attachment protein n=1 Tax=Dictyostelium purpureum TaxID=5786 RepID=F0ZCM5_DICPU|nr:soluble NSF attachment protein gamma isoform [Dictyostelium purpureum]EGC38320.1 soluble NSF attachment protein gamma isoform [Dictyostelium purpureum]|eukprot:XP_003285181.1 soluble NSF attachment protein gamma isoform [Dictyostelium purpureum]